MDLRHGSRAATASRLFDRQRGASRETTIQRVAAVSGADGSDEPGDAARCEDKD